MWFRRSDERELRMIWKVEKECRSSFLVGTAHFFPYSFRTSLTRLFQHVETVLFEGPLDEQSMQKVLDAGLRGGDDCLLSALDKPMLDRISNALRPSGQSQKLLMAFQIMAPVPDNVEALIKGMKHWMAFFAIYTRFAKKQGWKHSVDMEAYGLAQKMGRNIAFLETIEEQIEVLDGLSVPQIIDFLRRIDHWKSYMSNIVKWYLDSDLEQIASNPYGFPTRNPTIIERRDEILYRRMLPYLEQGDVAAFVGSPHVVGITRMLRENGFLVRTATA